MQQEIMKVANGVVGRQNALIDNFVLQYPQYIGDENIKLVNNTVDVHTMQYFFAEYFEKEGGLYYKILTDTLQLTTIINKSKVTISSRVFESSKEDVRYWINTANNN